MKTAIDSPGEKCVLYFSIYIYTSLVTVMDKKLKGIEINLKLI